MVTQFKMPCVFPTALPSQEPLQLCAGDSWQADGATALPRGLPPSGWCAAVDGEATASGHAEPDPARAALLVPPVLPQCRPR